MMTLANFDLPLTSSKSSEACRRWSAPGIANCGGLTAAGGRADDTPAARGDTVAARSIPSAAATAERLEAPLVDPLLDTETRAARPSLSGAQPLDFPEGRERSVERIPEPVDG